LQPTLSSKEIGREIDRAARILDRAPRAEEIAESLPDDVPSFGTVADASLTASQRVEAATCLAETVGTTYGPACLSSCGMSRLCRERAHVAGDPARVGGQLVRLLPGVSSLNRASALSRGASPKPEEAAAGRELMRAAILLQDVMAPAAKPSGRRGPRPRTVASRKQ
jgi:hypothetical protein